MESLSKIARQRLHPSLTNPNYLVLRSRRLIFNSWAREISGGHLTVLDVGGRYQPYRPLFADRLQRYVAIDVEATEFVDVIADAQSLPFATASFDVVIATQVFEYIAKPDHAAKEMCRVLKPGGVVLASLAACAPRFGDTEYWRFTPLGLRTLLAPFAEVEIVPELYSLGSFVRNTNLALTTFLRYQPARRIHSVTLCPLLNLFGRALEGLKLTSNDQFTANYSVRARKAEV